MALTAEAVRVGVTGAVHMAPAGTTLPTSIAGALNGAFVDLGYISEDGITASNDVETTDLKGWQNAAVVRTLQTGHNFTLSFSMLETNAHTLELYFNDYTPGPGGTDALVKMTGDQGWRGCLVLDIVDGTNDMRIVLPDAQVTDFEDISIVSGDALQYGVTLSCYPDQSGNKAYFYLDTDSAS
jgi:hypothetical protein